MVNNIYIYLVWEQEKIYFIFGGKPELKQSNAGIRASVGEQFFAILRRDLVSLLEKKKQTKQKQLSLRIENLADY